MAFTYTGFKMKTKFAAFKMVSGHHHSRYSSLCVITSPGLWAGLRVWLLSNRTYQTDVTWLLRLGFKRRVANVSDSCSIICGETRSSVMRYSQGKTYLVRGHSQAFTCNHYYRCVKISCQILRQRYQLRDAQAYDSRTVEIIYFWFLRC